MLEHSTIAQQVRILMHQLSWISSGQVTMHYMCHNEHIAL